MVGSVVSSGWIAAVRAAVSPVYRFSSLLSSVTAEAMTGGVTVTAHSAFTVPHVAVMTVSPAAFAVTIPFSTVATSSFEELQTMVSVVFSGWTVAFREAVFPAVSVSSVWSSVTPVAGVTSRVSSRYSSYVVPAMTSIMLR